MGEQESIRGELPAILPPEQYLAQVMATRSLEVDKTAREEHKLLSDARVLVRNRQAEQFTLDLEASGLDVETYFRDQPDGTIEAFRRLGLIK